MEQILELILHTETFIMEWVRYNEPLTYVLLFSIIFSETGLIIFPFFPGDLLLFTVGAIALSGALNIWILVPLLIAAAILGNISNYFIGRFAGQRLLRIKNSIFQNYMQRTNNFYDEYGGRAVLYSRFFPILRTYVPFVGGITRMEFKDYLKYSVIGGVIWVCIFTIGGYLVSDIPIIRDNFEKAIFIIIIFTLIPFFWKMGKSLFVRLSSSKA